MYINVHLQIYISAKVSLQPIVCLSNGGFNQVFCYTEAIILENYLVNFCVINI